MIISIWSHLSITTTLITNNNTIIWITYKYRKVFIIIIIIIVEGDCCLIRYLLIMAICWSSNPCRQAQQSNRDSEHRHPFRISRSIRSIRISRRKLIWIKLQEEQELEDSKHNSHLCYCYPSNHSYSCHSNPNHRNHSFNNNSNSHSRLSRNDLQHCKSRTAWHSQE